MTQWIFEHPWMTLFIIVALISLTEIVVKVICKTIIILARGRSYKCRTKICTFICRHRHNCEGSCWECPSFYHCPSCDLYSSNHKEDKRDLQ